MSIFRMFSYYDLLAFLLVSTTFPENSSAGKKWKKRFEEKIDTINTNILDMKEALSKNSQID